MSALDLDHSTKAKVKTLGTALATLSGSGNPSRGGGGGNDDDDGDTTTRIDVSKGAKHVVTFANNLEKDTQYKHLPRSLGVSTIILLLPRSCSCSCYYISLLALTHILTISSSSSSLFAP